MQITLIDGSTREVEHRRPPRFVLWRHSRAMTTFQSKVDEIAEGFSTADPQEQGMRFLESLTDEEGTKYQAFIDDIVKHSHHPQVSVDRISEESYWTLFGMSFYGTPETKVDTTEGVTDVRSVETFPEKSGLPETGEEMQDVSE